MDLISKDPDASPARDGNHEGDLIAGMDLGLPTPKRQHVPPVYQKDGAIHEGTVGADKPSQLIADPVPEGPNDIPRAPGMEGPAEISCFSRTSTPMTLTMIFMALPDQPAISRSAMSYFRRVAGVGTPAASQPWQA